MISKRMQAMAKSSSEIRAMFEEGRRLAEEFGAENVYDFSLGNPSVPAPDTVNRVITDVITDTATDVLHGYMPNAGYPDVRAAVADHLNRRFGFDYTPDNILMTVGAAGGLNCILQALLDPGDEVVVFAPYFLEYGNYVENFGGVLRAVPADKETFLPDPDALEKAVTPRTKVLILNNPNNPTGVVYPEKSLQKTAEALSRCEAKIGHPIYVVADEPYRELVYDGATVPFLPKLYNNVISVYSWSKSLSLPGERIGYVAVSPRAEGAEDIFTAAVNANRILGFVNAPSLQQKVVARCLDNCTDVSAYDKNRRELCRILTESGFTYTEPQGAFYLWVKTPCEDKAFVAEARKQHILLVSGASFACPGYVRMAYCVPYERILRSEKAFKALGKLYR